MLAFEAGKIAQAGDVGLSFAAGDYWKLWASPKNALWSIHLGYIRCCIPVPDTSFYLGPFNENMAIAYDYDVISENPLF